MRYLNFLYCGPSSRLNVLFFLSMATLLTGCFTETAQKDPTFITWESREMDTWASVWLINQYIAPGAHVKIRPTGSPTQEGIAFALPDAQFKKTNGRSTFESLVSHYNIDAPEVKAIAGLIRAIEVAPWANSGDHLARQVENAFRGMDKQFRPGKVPVSCYQSFFSGLAKSLHTSDNKSQLDASTLITTDCSQPIVTSAYRDQTQYVRHLDINQILESIGKGKKVIFVDTRESSEFEETHIPGAINMTLRSVTPEVKSQFDGADLVVPYCIKDFRGYEVAQALHKLGVANVATMKPYGLAGWRSYQLPTVGVDALTESTASQALIDCIRGKKNCFQGEPG